MGTVTNEGHAFLYVGHFTDSYLGAIDLDMRHPEASGPCSPPWGRRCRRKVHRVRHEGRVDEELETQSAQDGLRAPRGVRPRGPGPRVGAERVRHPDHHGEHPRPRAIGARLVRVPRQARRRGASLRPLADCNATTVLAIDDYTTDAGDGGTDKELPHLYALVTQTTRGEVAVIDTTSINNYVLDQDPSVPGRTSSPSALSRSTSSPRRAAPPRSSASPRSGARGSSPFLPRGFAPPPPTARAARAAPTAAPPAARSRCRRSARGPRAASRPPRGRCC